MKERPEYFLANDKIDHSEPFDYIVELHNYLWRFVCVAIPSAHGSLSDYIDPAIERLEMIARVLELIKK